MGWSPGWGSHGSCRGKLTTTKRRKDAFSFKVWGLQNRSEDAWEMESQLLRRSEGFWEAQSKAGPSPSAQPQKSLWKDALGGIAAPSCHRKCPIGTSPVGEVSPALGPQMSGPLSPLNTQSLSCSLRDCSSPVALWTGTSEESRGKVELGLALGERSRPPISGKDRGFHSYPRRAWRHRWGLRGRGLGGGPRAFLLAEIIGSLVRGEAWPSQAKRGRVASVLDRLRSARRKLPHGPPLTSASHGRSNPPFRRKSGDSPASSWNLLTQ